MTKRKLTRSGVSLSGYVRASYDELAILDYLSRGMSYPRIARETRTSRDDIAKSVIAMCNKVGAPNPKALVSGYVAWVEG